MNDDAADNGDVEREYEDKSNCYVKNENTDSADGGDAE